MPRFIKSPNTGKDSQSLMIYRILIAGGALAVNAQKDGEQDGEAPEGGAAITEEGERDAYYWGDAQHHTYIYK